MSCIAKITGLDSAFTMTESEHILGSGIGKEESDEVEAKQPSGSETGSIPAPYTVFARSDAALD